MIPSWTGCFSISSHPSSLSLSPSRTPAGQTRTVHVTRITIKDTVEERILQLQESKRQVCAREREQGLCPLKGWGQACVHCLRKRGDLAWCKVTGSGIYLG